MTLTVIPSETRWGRGGEATSAVRLTEWGGVCVGGEVSDLSFQICGALPPPRPPLRALCRCSLRLPRSWWWS